MATDKKAHIFITVPIVLLILKWAFKSEVSILRYDDPYPVHVTKTWWGLKKVEHRLVWMNAPGWPADRNPTWCFQDTDGRWREFFESPDLTEALRRE
jgi:hypothetical protein